MWTIKKFKTAELRDKWLAKNESRYQIVEVFINNVAFALEVRPLRRVY